MDDNSVGTSQAAVVCHEPTKAKPHLAFELLQFNSFVGRMLVDAQNSTRPCAQHNEFAARLPNAGKYRKVATCYAEGWRRNEVELYATSSQNVPKPNMQVCKHNFERSPRLDQSNRSKKMIGSPETIDIGRSLELCL